MLTLNQKRGKEEEVDEDDDDVCELGDDASYILSPLQQQRLVTLEKLRAWVGE